MNMIAINSKNFFHFIVEIITQEQIYEMESHEFQKIQDVQLEIKSLQNISQEYFKLKWKYEENSETKFSFWKKIENRIFHNSIIIRHLNTHQTKK